MRRVLLDYARKRATAKRGGSSAKLALSEPEGRAGQRDLDLIALDQALTNLAAMDPQQGRVVELRYFGGLTSRIAPKSLAFLPPR